MCSIPQNVAWHAIIPLCNSHDMLHHVLNKCTKMLDRHSWWHNTVLNRIVSLLKSAIPGGFILSADLPRFRKGSPTIPVNVFVIKLKFDIVIFDPVKSPVTTTEQTTPFEQNQFESHNRKVDTYCELIITIESKGYAVNLYIIEVRSRGYITKGNIKHFKSIFYVANIPIKIHSM